MDYKKYKAIVECDEGTKDLFGDNFEQLKKTACAYAEERTSAGKKWRIAIIKRDEDCPLLFLEGVVSRNEEHWLRVKGSPTKNDEPRGYTQQQIDTIMWLYGVQFFLANDMGILRTALGNVDNPLNKRVMRLFYDPVGNKGGEIGKRIRKNSLGDIDFRNLPDKKAGPFDEHEAQRVIHHMSVALGRFLIDTFDCPAQEGDTSFFQKFV